LWTPHGIDHRGGTVLAGRAGAASAQGASPQRVRGASSQSAKRVLRVPALKPGDRVRVVSPGSTPDPTNMARGIEILRSWGLTVELGAHVFTKYGYLAGTDAQRLADLNAALNDPGIRAVFAARGGYGTQRIVDQIDVSGLRPEPRVAGVVIGQITNSVGEPDEWDAAAVLTDRLYDLGVPVLGGLRLGHGNGQLTVPLGAWATIDAEAGTLTVEAGVRPR
jgi:muramoyltetrapeptide carboxypeptidase LdcA involved in peptidoglycan recycling